MATTHVTPRASSEVPLSPVWAPRRQDIPMYLVAALVVLPILLVRTIWFPFPIGDGGLFALMSELIGRHGFHVPAHVPYYGLHGVPFAYPPLAFYVMAVFTRVVYVDPLFYIRFAPLVLMAIFIPVFYTFARTVLQSRVGALAATVLLLTSPEFLGGNGETAGFVRLLALIFAFLTFLAASSAFKTGSWSATGSASILLGLTAMTHPEAVAFAGITLVCLVLGTESRARAVSRLVVILLGGVIVSSPWWGVVIHRFGLATLVDPLRSHGGMAPHAAAYPLSPLRFLETFTVPHWYYVLLAVPRYALAVVGLALCLWARRWFLPALFVALFAFAPLRTVYLCVAAALLGGYALDVVLPVVRRSSVTGLPSWSGPLVVACILGLASAQSAGFLLFSFHTAHLRGIDLQTASWIRTHTAPSSTYLLVESGEPEGEWLPYLTHRTQVPSVWGAEWTSHNARDGEMQTEIGTCATSQSPACVRRVMRDYRLRPDYLVTRRDRYPALYHRLLTSGAWRVVYANSSYGVLRRAAA